MAQEKRQELSVRSEKAVLVGVILPKSTTDPRDPLGELAALAKTAGAVVVERLVQNRATIDPATYIGQGKAKEVAQLVTLHQADVVIFDNDMSPNQLRELEKICNCKILDRSELILDIFGTRARTKEAQLQVALAQLEYTYPRLRHMWSHLERIGSGAGAGVGARGPGEMQLEVDRRLVRDKVSELKVKLKEIQARKSREVAERKRQHFTISLVGYTNAGKSTMFNTLTGAGTFVEDKLFATLDTKTRNWNLGSTSVIKAKPSAANPDLLDDADSAPETHGGGHGALISDTVGFVRDLPHHLVASFKATLEEAVHADMLLVVLDVSHPHAQQQLRSVQQVLMDIGCGNSPALLCLNKIDAVTAPDDLAFWRSAFPNALPVSAKQGDGVAELTAVVREQMLGQIRQAKISIPLRDSKGVTFVEKYAEVQARDYETTPGEVILDVQIAQRILEQLPNNVSHAKVLATRLSTIARPWRCSTRQVKELIPDIMGSLVNLDETT